MLEYDITYTILVDVVDSVVRLQRKGQPLFLAQSSWLAHKHKPPPTTVHDFAASTHPQMRSNASFAVTRFQSYIANRVSEVPKSFNFLGFEYLRENDEGAGGERDYVPSGKSGRHSCTGCWCLPTTTHSPCTMFVLFAVRVVWGGKSADSSSFYPSICQFSIKTGGWLSRSLLRMSGHGLSWISFVPDTLVRTTTHAHAPDSMQEKDAQLPLPMTIC